MLGRGATLSASAVEQMTGVGVTHIPPDMRPTEAELLAEVHRLTYIAARVRRVQTWVEWVDGRAVVKRDRPEPALPVVGSLEWWEAPERIRIAALLTLAKAYLLADPERMVAERLKAASVAISDATKGSWRRPSHSTLAARRAKPGPLARPFDPQTAARWVETGSSEGPA